MARYSGDNALATNPLDGVIYFRCPECKGPVAWNPDAESYISDPCPFCGALLRLTQREYLLDGRYQTRYDLEA